MMMMTMMMVSMMMTMVIIIMVAVVTMMRRYVLCNVNIYQYKPPYSVLYQANFSKMHQTQQKQHTKCKTAVQHENVQTGGIR